MPSLPCKPGALPCFRRSHRRAPDSQEEAEGNLEEAIETYKKILADYPGNRPVVARAMLHMGQCYEKLGNEEARKAYERLVRDYADQSEQARLARSRLAALAGPRPTTLATRRLENPPADVPMGAASPDGRYLSFWDWRTGDLAVRELTTGKDRRLTSASNVGNTGSAVSQEAQASAWSSDSKQIAYSRYVRSDVERVELRVVGLDGSKTRVLSHYDGFGVSLDSFAWSPDGKRIVASLYTRKGPSQMVLTSTTDGSTRVLTELKCEIFPTTKRFSPDGRYILFSAPDPADLQNWDLWHISVEGGKPEKMGLQRRWGISSITARPDGRQLAFAGSGGPSSDSELWVPENFLPAVGNSK